MSPDHPRHESRDGQADDRYGGVATDGEYIVYDRENHQAWIQSTVAVDIAEVQ